MILSSNIKKYVKEGITTGKYKMEFAKYCNTIMDKLCGNQIKTSFISTA